MVSMVTTVGMPRTIARQLDYAADEAKQSNALLQPSSGVRRHCCCVLALLLSLSTIVIVGYILEFTYRKSKHPLCVKGTHISQRTRLGLKGTAT